MKIEEYLKSLPPGIISGQQVELRADAIRRILGFADAGPSDVFLHLGCGSAESLGIALEEFGVSRAVGVDNDPSMISQAKERVGTLKEAVLYEQDILDCDIHDATAILFWFADEKIIEYMMPRFSGLKPGCRIITIWAPLPCCIPAKVDFPYILNRVPLQNDATLQDQLLAVFGVKCIDFVTAWEHAERYTAAIGSPDAGNDRFLTILQSVLIWINARNMGVACTDDIPESIKTYIGILENFFGIEVEHLLNADPASDTATPAAR